MGCVIVNILLAHQHSADEVGEGQERRDGDEGLGASCQHGRIEIGYLTREPLHAAIRQLDEQSGLGPWGGHPQQRERPPIQRMSGVDNGHLTSRQFRYRGILTF